MVVFTKIFHFVQQTGDYVGKIISFLTLPATILAGFTYFDEITDYFSPPSLSAEIKHVTVRCNYVWRDSKDYSAYQYGDTSKFRKLCEDSKIAVSFEFSIMNNDSIDRELKTFLVSASIPGYSDLALDEIQNVEHLIQGGMESNLRRDWRVEKISAGSTLIFEILAFSSLATDKQNWANIATRMDERDPTLLNKSISVKLQAQSNGFSKELHILETCSFPINEKEFAQWHKRPKAARIRITGDCN